MHNNHSNQKIDRTSFQLGMINCFAEMVACGVKKMAISPPVTPDEYEKIKDASDKIVAGFQIKSYLEKSLLLTDLQTPDFTKSKWSILYYEKDEVLAEYLALKNKKQQFEASHRYDKNSRQDISRQFLRLLSYPAEKIEQILSRQKTQDPFILIED
ncbi:hypothetical protein ACFL02_01710 [Planctomycetota bacterium]